LAYDLYKEFRDFTCKNANITLSAGVTIVDPKFPIYKSAELAGEALDEKAKTGEKNRVCIFDEVFRWDVPPKETEFDTVLKLKDMLYDLLHTKKVSRALLYRIFETYADFEEFKKELERGEMKVHRVWRLLYLLKRFGERHKNAVSELKDIENIYIDTVWNKINWDEKGIKNKPEIIPAAVKWAELLTRGGEG